ncbi:MAG: hypothetical protein HUU50_13660 [Candidatus Brocadiae bacterium]|nr:hypothetical protein [Candidatus Brocadiia bacterium]
MENWEKTFLRYCVAQGLLGVTQAKNILEERSKESFGLVNILLLVMARLGWDENTAFLYLKKALPEEAEGIFSQKIKKIPDKIPKEKESRDFSIGFASDLARIQQQDSKSPEEKTGQGKESRDFSIGFASDLARIQQQDSKSPEEKKREIHAGETKVKPIPDGPKLGNYIIIKKLGAGGMGVVYKAYHPNLDR